MEIFRHYYSGATAQGEWNTSVFFKKHMNNFGFCKMDGSPITMNWSDRTGDLTMRYKLDPKKQVYLYNDAYMTGSAMYCNAANVCCHLSNMLTDNPHDRFYHMASNSSNLSGGVLYGDASVVFIPLKNQGFLLNIRGGRTTETDQTANKTNPSYYSTDPRDKGFLLPTPTPSLNVKVYSNITKNSGDCPGALTFIGLPPCKGNNNWTYLLYIKNAYITSGGESGTYTKALIDFGDGKVYDMPFKSNFIRSTSTTSYNELTYTDINNNVCSLVKMPYDTGYIDGLYLMTTSPQQLEDCTFFSFDGRNFLNVFENYVLELPSSSS